MKKHVLVTVASACALALAACGDQAAEPAEDAAAPAPQQAAEAPQSGSATFGQVDAARLENAAAEPGQWMTHGGTYWEQRYSTLAEVTTENVGELGVAWWGDYDTNINQQGTPIYVDGVLYVSTARSKVYAFDARTGQQLWKYDPFFDPAVAAHVCCGLVNRGVAVWEGKVYVGTLDGRLIALNAETGEEIFDRQVADREGSESITLALRAVEGKILLGVSGGEYKVRGWMGAFDANTGDELWRFYTVPGNPADGFENEAMAMAAETWITPGWWEVGGGGPVWDSLIYDPTTRLVYFGTGNGTPWNAEHRDSGGGDNLFLASIVAVNIDDGSYAWHYQENPAETWDYDATAPLMIADLEIDGAQRHVIMHAPKNGFFYTLDAGTGELLEANPFANMNWATGIGEDGRPIEVPGARYDLTDEAWNMLPGPAGAHGWVPMAYSPQTGLVYVPTSDMYMVFEQTETYEKAETGFNLGIQFPASNEYYERNPDAPRSGESYLRAIHPVTGEIVWQSAERAGGGALATAGGLVFQGGGGERTVRAFNAATGEKLWEQEVHTSATAGPITYELDGKQYVAFSVGGTAPGGDYFAPANARLIVYTRGGTATLPEPAVYTPRQLDPPAQTAALEAVESGRELYGANCAGCHGPDATGGRAALPNLTRTPVLHSQAALDAVVIQGGRADLGMPAFPNLTSDQTGQILAFLVARAHEEVELAAARGPGGFGGPGGGGGGGAGADDDDDAEAADDAAADDAAAAEEPAGDGIHQE